MTLVLDFFGKKHDSTDPISHPREALFALIEKIFPKDSPPNILSMLMGTQNSSLLPNAFICYKFFSLCSGS